MLLVAAVFVITLLSSSASADLSAAQQQVFQDGIPYFDINAGSACSSGTSGPTQLTGSDNQEKIFNYFTGKGLTAIQAAAIDGNFAKESTWNPSDPGGYLAQWSGNRLTALQALAQKRKPARNGFGRSKLDYVWLELTNGPGAGEDRSNVLTALKAANDITTATTVFMGTLSSGGTIDGYENPGSPQLQNRITYANNILQQYGGSAVVNNNGGPTSCAGAVNCNSPSTTPGLSQTRQQIVCIAQQELALWKSSSRATPHLHTPKTVISHIAKTAPRSGVPTSPHGCITRRTIRCSPVQAGTSSYVPDIQSIGQQNSTFHWHPASSNYVPKPGDLAIHGSSHVNIFISSSGSTAQYIGGDQGSGPYPGGSIVSIETGNGYYDNGITGYVSPD